MSFLNMFGVYASGHEQRVSDDMRAYFTKDLFDYKIPDGVTSIRPYCFYNFWPEVPMRIVLPKTLKNISPHAFAECGVESVSIPGSVEEIADDAFEGSAIKECTFGEGIKKIGNRAFMNGPQLTRLILPDSVEYIGDDAFSGMDTTEGAIVEIGEGIQHIGNQAFDCNVRSMVIHRKFGAFQDGSYGYFDDNGDWHDAVWYGGRTENPAAIWDGVD